jgi:anthranilate synthase component 1
MGLYRDVVVFDHVAKVVYIVHWVDLAGCSAGLESSRPLSTGDVAVASAYSRGMKHLDELVGVLTRGVPLSALPAGTVSINVGAGSRSDVENSSNMTREQFNAALDRIHTHIVDGDSFQIVFSQRFERWSGADPFSTYRALRVVNPSPYMIYMQCDGSTLVASSPEILCRVVDRVVTNRPLAGTRRRGRTPEEDAALEKELLADEKDVAEHRMLVDLGRNDVGRIAELGTVNPTDLLVVEHYSNVMHISSTVTGVLQEGLSSWDALRAALPAGTVSGAPKIRSMQIIDDLEPTRRGPYGGGIGFISFADTMNMALALRTMVIPHATRTGPDGARQWRYYLQAGAGIVLDSDKNAEYDECVNKAMALNRAVDLAETAFASAASSEDVERADILES